MNQTDLLSSSQRLMHLALAGLGADDLQADVVVLHAGVAVEHALKAFLCSVSPSLVVDGRDFPSLLHGAGRGELAKKPLPMIKTIGAMEAFMRVSKILDGHEFDVSEHEFRLIADARNGVAHIGIRDTAQVEDLLSTGLRIVDAVLKSLGEDAAAYWGDFSVVHEKILDVKRQADLIRIEALKTRALRRLVERFGTNDTEERRAAIASAQSHTVVAGQAKALRPCPACLNQGWVGGDLDTDYSGDEGQVIIVTQYFLCSVCGFSLHGDLLRYFNDLYEDIPLGPAATFVYADGSLHEDVWLEISAEVAAEFMADEEEEELRGRR
ncbi:hypothetical protein ACFWFU_24410 [Streptomyces sp. NPDC060235]|uniref:hypothetical protein n=1 Tax=Streptomyces sp. NPDC060235 TaxID=3347080 RepID=UPI00364B8502